MYTVKKSLNCGCILHISEPQVIVSLGTMEHNASQYCLTLESCMGSVRCC